MFERFTDRARQVVTLAQVAARSLDHDYIGTEHLLLGLLSEGEGIGGRTLTSLGFSYELLQSEVESVVGRGKGEKKGHIPFTPRAKKSLELSLREALKLGHNYIGTEHLLLGIVRLGEGVAFEILDRMVDGGAKAVDTAVYAMLLDAGSISRQRARAHGPVGPHIVLGGNDQVIVRLEAIEARLSAIEALLRAQGEQREAQ